MEIGEMLVPLKHSNAWCLADHSSRPSVTCAMPRHDIRAHDFMSFLNFCSRELGELPRALHLLLKLRPSNHQAYLNVRLERTILNITYFNNPVFSLVCCWF